MVRVRGVDLLDAEAFVRDGYGADAVERVFAALDEESRAVFSRPPHGHDWYPLEALRSYLVTAKAAVAPDETDFYRRQGRFAAERRKRGPLQSMVATPELRMRLARTVWRMFYDGGRLEVVGDLADTAVARIHGFPARPELCERFRGIWEGLAGPGARAEEARCVLRGDPFCELHVVYPRPG